MENLYIDTNLSIQGCTENVRAALETFWKWNKQANGMLFAHQYRYTKHLSI